MVIALPSADKVVYHAIPKSRLLKRYVSLR